MRCDAVPLDGCLVLWLPLQTNLHRGRSWQGARLPISAAGRPMYDGISLPRTRRRSCPNTSFQETKKALQDFCRQHCLPVSGTKDVLEARVRAELVEGRRLELIDKTRGRVCAAITHVYLDQG